MLRNVQRVGAIPRALTQRFSFPSATFQNSPLSFAAPTIWTVEQRLFYSRRPELSLLEKRRTRRWNSTKSEAENDPSSTTKANGSESGNRTGESNDSGDKASDGPRAEGGQAKKEAPPPPPPHGDKSPWTVFMDTMRSEFKQSKEWQESTKALSSSAHQFTESPSVKRAREAYEKTSSAASSTTASTLKKAGQAIGSGAAKTWDSTVVKAGRSAVRSAGQGVASATKPVRDTDIYKSVTGTVKDVIDDGSSSRYGGFLEKEERKQARARREAKLRTTNGNLTGKTEELVEDPNAGTNVTVHKDAAWRESWREFRDSNKFMQSLFGMKRTYEESENPVISSTRDFADRIAGFFAENETAKVIRKMREIDPGFQTEPFIRELREYILPEVLDAYVKGDGETLRQWLSAAQYSVYSALAKQYQVAGLRSDGRVLDIRNVDIMTAKLLEPGEVPVFIISCRTQEVHVYKNLKSGQLAAGMEDKIQQVTYAIGITRIPEEVANKETKGWRLIELQKHGRDYY